MFIQSHYCVGLLKHHHPQPRQPHRTIPPSTTPTSNNNNNNFLIIIRSASVFIFSRSYLFPWTGSRWQPASPPTTETPRGGSRCVLGREKPPHVVHNPEIIMTKASAVEIQQRNLRMSRLFFILKCEDCSSTPT